MQRRERERERQRDRRREERRGKTSFLSPSPFPGLHNVLTGEPILIFSFEAFLSPSPFTLESLFAVCLCWSFLLSFSVSLRPGGKMQTFRFIHYQVFHFLLPLLLLFPTSNSLLINFRLRKCRKFVSMHRLSIQIDAKCAKKCMQCLFNSTELPFCIALLVVGFFFQRILSPRATTIRRTH